MPEYIMKRPVYAVSWLHFLYKASRCAASFLLEGLLNDVSVNKLRNVNARIIGAQ
jgi:hypothetical protein